MRRHRAGDQHPQHRGELVQESIERLHRRVGGFGPVDCHLDATCELLDRNAAYEFQFLCPADARDRCGDLSSEAGRIGLVEVAGLREMFGEQLLQMRRTFER